MLSKTVLCVAAAALFASPALAHHPGAGGGAGGAGPIATFTADVLDPGQVAVAFLYEYIRLGGLDDAGLIDAASHHQHAHSIRSIESKSVGFAFGVAENFAILARLPYVTRTDIREGEHSHGPGGPVNEVVARGDAAGVGDLTVLGQYRFYANRMTGTSFAALFGFKAPTGRTDLRDLSGELFEAEFQPGSGSFDGLFGAAFTQRLGARAAFSANVLYFRTGTGTQDTNLGDRFHYNAAVSYRLFGPAAAEEAHAHSHAHNPSGAARMRRLANNPLAAPPATPVAETALDVVLELNGEWHDYQRVAGVIDPSSGGRTVYLSPGLRVTHGQGSGFLSIGVPVVNEMNGIQSRPDYRVLAGAAFSFAPSGGAR